MARVGSRHLQIEDEDVGASGVDQLRGGGRIVGLADHPQVILCFEHASQPGADHVVIVGQNDGYLLLICLRSAHLAEFVRERRTKR